KAVNERHGFTVTSTTQYSNRNSKSGNMRIRIPSPEFDAMLESIMKVSSQVFSKTISGNDVTEEFFDVSARLRNKQMVESRFRETLRLAKSVKDILAVEESLGNIREEIEQLEGRRKFLVDQTALSTIDASLREPSAFVDVEQSFWGKVTDGFRQGGRSLGDVVSFIVTMVIAGFPIMIILLILAFVALSVVKLRRSGRRHA
ncbi:MAG: DUF4349 domain-containing protein, partial [Ignavibacteriales bacterium]|nr:DUF4349 domain-containing protein [Ignavibacteriales bacterium]